MFTVLADSRTGSHLLKSLLNSHPQLTCYDEILGLRKNEANFFGLSKNQGCLVSYLNVLPDNPFSEGNEIPLILDIIRHNPVIHLTRDLEERAKSHLFYCKAKQQSEVFRKANLEQPKRFNKELDEHDLAELEQIKKAYRVRQEQGLELFRGYRANWLELTYEWLCGGQELKILPTNKAAKICRYLQVPVTSLASNLYKIRKFDN